MKQNYKTNSNEYLFFVTNETVFAGPNMFQKQMFTVLCSIISLQKPCPFCTCVEIMPSPLFFI